MKIDAKLLQDSLSFLGLVVTKSATARPITKMLELKTEDGFLYGTACDEQTYLRLKICPTTEELKSLVEFELFSNIIKSCSGELELKESTNALSIKSATMKCKVPSSFNRANTSMPTMKIQPATKTTDFSSLKEILPICRSILKLDFSVECYRHIFFKDKIMVTDTDNVAVIPKQFFDEEALLSYKTVEILSQLKHAKYLFIPQTHNHTKKDFKHLHIQTDNLEMVCISNYVENFQYDDLNDLFSATTDEVVSVNKSELSRGYSVAKNFKNASINLVFNSEGVCLTIPRQDFVYKVSESTTNKEYVFSATDELMKKILTLHDDIEISILDSMIKCTSNNIEEIFSVTETSNVAPKPVPEKVVPTTPEEVPF